MRMTPKKGTDFGNLSTENFNKYKLTSVTYNGNTFRVTSSDYFKDPQKNLSSTTIYGMIVMLAQFLNALGIIETFDFATVYDNMSVVRDNNRLDCLDNYQLYGTSYEVAYVWYDCRTRETYATLYNIVTDKFVADVNLHQFITDYYPLA